MRKRTLGRTGIQVGELGMGCEGFVDKSPEQIRELVDSMASAGVTCIDLYTPNPAVRDGLGLDPAEAVQTSNFIGDAVEMCREMGFRHKNLLTFLTVMPLAVSPEIKCTDMGLLDVAHKKFLPLVEGIEEDG